MSEELPEAGTAPATRRRYFDNAASCLPTDAARAAAATFGAQPWAGANPNSLHADGRAAFKALQDARASLARSLGAHRPSEVILTGGGTEANNMAVRGLARAARAKSRNQRTRVLVSAIEHESVLELKAALAHDGLTLQTIAARRDGQLDVGDLERKLGPDVACLSVMAANNETGVVQPLADVVRLARGWKVPVHTDAVQAFGHMPLPLGALGVDAASVTAHKLGGPVGIGALWLRTRTPFEPLTFGGGQEGGLRPGTVDVRGACVFAQVAADAVAHLDERRTQAQAVADVLVEGLCAGEHPVARPSVGDVATLRATPHLPGIVSLLVDGHQSEGLILALDDAGFSVAGGSACSSGSLDPSHVLSAMGVPRDEALCALRLSFDHRITCDDARELVAALRAVCDKAGAR